MLMGLDVLFACTAQCVCVCDMCVCDVCVLKCLAAVRWAASLICADSFVIGALHEEGGPAADSTPTV